MIEEGSLGSLHPPKDFIDAGRVLLWCMSHDCHYSIPVGSPALVVMKEKAWFSNGKKPEQIEMVHVHIGGLPYRIRADWLHPISS